MLLEHDKFGCAACTRSPFLDLHCQVRTLAPFKLFRATYKSVQCHDYRALAGFKDLTSMSETRLQLYAVMPYEDVSPVFSVLQVGLSHSGCSVHLPCWQWSKCAAFGLFLL